MFSSSTYVQRRNLLMTQVQSGIIILMGNLESPMNFPDNAYHFRQDSSFLYFFGLDVPGLVGIIDIDDKKDYIYGNDFTIDEIVWMGKQPTIKESAKKAGVEYTGSLSQVEEVIKNSRKSNRKIHFLPPYRADNKIQLSHWLETTITDLNKLASIELIMSVVAQRIIKSNEEIEQIHEAAIISADMHLTAMRLVKPRMTESEIMAAVTQVAFASGGNLSFPIIATKNGQTLHNHYYGNTLKDGDLFLLDAGAETTMHYAGDLSSTFPVSKRFTDRQKEVYNVSIMAHERAVSMLKPGINFKDIHLAACTIIAEGMKAMGFMKGNIEDALKEGAHAMFMPCGVGHMLGLDVHDMEDIGEIYVGYDGKPTRSKQFGLKSLRLARELQSGFVLTIEPGIYFIPELIDKWRAEKKFTEFLNYDKLEQYKDFGGIRNEENYVITATGAKLLGKELPKTVEKVEAERGGI